MDTVTHWSFGLDVPGGFVTAVVVVVAFGIVAYLGLKTNQTLDPSKRKWMSGLRIATCAMAVLVTVQPAWTGEKSRDVLGRLFVLIDQSRSLSVDDGDGPRSEQVRELLTSWSGQSNPATYYGFGETARAAELASLLESVPIQGRTRIVAGVSEVLAQGESGESPLGAVIVVSDGRDTGAVPSEELGIRVHTVSVGRSDLNDDAIAQVDADPVAFLRQQGEVRVRVRTSRELDSLPVQLRSGDQLVDHATARFDGSSEAEVTLSFTPTRVGRQTYRISIPVATEDRVPENNERAFLVRVTRDKLRVLLVAGQPSWDQRFLRSFLKEDPSIDLISFFILRSSTDLTMASPDDLALIPFPTDELFSEHLGSFDLIFFQNFEFGPYQMASYLPGIRDYVRRGGAFAMIGGDLSFGSGGFAGTAVGEILPVEVPPASAGEAQLIVEGSFVPSLSRVGQRHPLVRLELDPGRNLSRWAELSPLVGANRIRRVRPAGQVLLEHPTARTLTGDPLPVLTVGPFGEGRVLALAADTSYRWGITTAGATGDGSAYGRFWDLSMRWLTKDPALDPSRVVTDKESYGPVERMAIEGRVRTQEYAPIISDEATLIIVDGSEERQSEHALSADSEGRFDLTVEAPAQDGAFEVRVIDEAGETLCSESFLVESGGLELADPRADPEFLRTLAEENGGRFVQASELPDLDSFDSNRTEFLGLERFAPFSHWIPMVLLVALFSLEWILRRRFGQR